MDAVNKVLETMQGWMSTVIGWFSSLVGAIVPSADADDGKKSSFVKYTVIILGLFVAAKVLRLNLNIGGRRK